jgi:hypothetical protein
MTRTYSTRRPQTANNNLEKRSGFNSRPIKIDTAAAACKLYSTAIQDNNKSTFIKTNYMKD